MKDKQELLSVELLISTECAHCPIMLNHFSKIVKEGLISELKVLNVAMNPEIAVEREIRSVPWARVNEFILEGSYTYEELKTWIDHANNNSGEKEYFLLMLNNQQLEKAINFTQNNLSRLDLLINLLADLQTTMAVRIGISAIFEDLSEKGKLESALPNLIKLLDSKHEIIRIDAVYFLSLLDYKKVERHLKLLRNDRNQEIKDIVSEFFQKNI